MTTVADPNELKGEVPQPWEGEQRLIDGLLDQKGGEWVVAAAFLDYGSLTDTTSTLRYALSATREMEKFGAVRAMNEAAAIEFSHRLLRDSELADEVDEEARRIAELVPKGQHDAVVALGNGFLDATAGHIGVAKLIDTLEPEPPNTPALSQ